MNDKFDTLLYESGLTAQGCWDQMDDYDRTAIMKFGELVARKCLSEVALMGITNFENEDISWATDVIMRNIKHKFGITNESTS